MRRSGYLWLGPIAVVLLIGIASAAMAATRLVPENNATVVTLNDRAVSLFNKVRYDQSIAVLGQIVSRFPDSGLAYANRGAVYFQIGKFDEAIKDYTEAIGLGRNEPVVMLNRGTAYFKKGDYDRALEDCNAIIRTMPRNAVAYRTCGISYEAKGDRERAFSNFDESIRLDPRASKTYEARGLAYARSGLPEKALADLKQAERLDPAVGKESQVAEAIGKANTAVSNAPAAVAAPTPPKTPEQVAAATPAATQTAPDGEIRVALVIGNSDYSSVPRLPNPQIDASAVADSLRAAGFKTVTLDDNLGAAAMRQALNDFSNEAAKADWAMVYYAGHGIEVSGTNYLIPTDAKLKTDRAVEFEAVSLDSVLASVEGAHKLRIVVLDACRDNPFLRDMARTTASRSVGRGLARIEPDTGATLVAYSAKAGQVAMDGPAGTDSPFALALIRNMKKPGIEIRKFFGLVRDDVMAATGNAQEPFVYGSLGGDDYFFRKP